MAIPFRIAPDTRQALARTFITAKEARLPISSFQVRRIHAQIERHLFTSHETQTRKPSRLHNVITKSSTVSTRRQKHSVSSKSTKFSPLRILKEPPYPLSTPEEAAALRQEFMQEVEKDIYVFKPMVAGIAANPLASGPAQQAQRRRVQRLIEVQYLEERSQLLRRAAGDKTARSARRSYNTLIHSINAMRVFIMQLERVRTPSGKPLSMNRYRLDSGVRVSMDEMDGWKERLRHHRALYNAVEADTPVEERKPEVIIHPIRIRSRSLAFILGLTDTPPFWMRTFVWLIVMMTLSVTIRSAWEHYASQKTRDQQVRAKADVLGRPYPTQKEDQDDNMND